MRRMLIGLLGGLLLALMGLPVAAQPAPAPVSPRAFATPEAGFATLAAAIATHDEAALLRVLGDAGRRLIRSGDPVADRAARDAFNASHAARSEILRPSADRAELVIGEDGWPLPLPMVRRDGRWRFDARAGAQALVDRRIGRNELDTIETLRAIVAAQLDYARGAGRQGGLRAYARRFFSTPGQRDGLYWPTAGDEAPSPLGPLVAQASAGGYGRGPQDGAPQPVHGYLFRMLEGQGPAAPGGEVDYVVDGRMLGGFAVLAVPATHGGSGIQAFLVSHDGVVWQRNLGPDTTRLAAGITRFDPGEGWSVVAE